MSKNQKRISLAAVAAILLVTALTAGFRRNKAGDVEGNLPMVVSVAKKSMTAVVTSSGEIEALKSTKIIPKIKNSAVVSFLVPEGTRVDEGQVIGRLNGDDLEIAIDELKQAIEDKKVVMEDANADVLIQEAVNQTNLKTAKDNLNAAKLELQKFDEADTIMRTREVELQVQTAESNLSRSTKRYADLQTLLKEGFITEDEVEEGRITLEQDRVSLETAKMDLKVLKEFTFPLERNDLANKLSKAEISLKKTETENASTLNTKRRAVQKAERDLKTQERTLEEREETLMGYTITAPTEGVVYYGSDGRSYSSRANIEIGGTIHAGYTMFTIPDFSGMKAEIDVAESEIHKLKLGLPVSLSVDAVPDRLFAGEIIKIAEVAKDGGFWRGGGVKEFEVEVSIESDEGLKPGYSCKAEVVTEEIPDALQLPVQAVYRQDKQFFVYLVEGRRYRKQLVEIGQTTTTHVQIKSGLEEGQKVYLTPPAAESDGGTDGDGDAEAAS